jgi:hypothetical protein
MNSPGPSVLCWLALFAAAVDRSIRNESRSFLARFPLESLETGVVQYHGFEVSNLEVAIRQGEVRRALLSFNVAESGQVAVPGALFEITLGAEVVGMGYVVGRVEGSVLQS